MFPEVDSTEIEAEIKAAVLEKFFIDQTSVASRLCNIPKLDHAPEPSQQVSACLSMLGHNDNLDSDDLHSRVDSHQTSAILNDESYGIGFSSTVAAPPEQNQPDSACPSMIGQKDNPDFGDLPEIGPQSTDAALPEPGQPASACLSMLGQNGIPDSDDFHSRVDSHQTSALLNDELYGIGFQSTAAALPERDQPDSTCPSLISQRGNLDSAHLPEILPQSTNAALPGPGQPASACLSMLGQNGNQDSDDFHSHVDSHQTSALLNEAAAILTPKSPGMPSEETGQTNLIRSESERSLDSAFFSGLISSSISDLNLEENSTGSA